MRMVDLAHREIGAVLGPGDIAFDATVGNGNDTLFLAQRVAPGGTVYGCDIQPEAIATTRRKLIEIGMESKCELFVADHAKIEQILDPEHRNRIKAAMFNLGYLPGGPRDITTQAESTRRALASTCWNLLAGGRVSVVCYTGHAGGLFETGQVQLFVDTLPEVFRVRVHLAAQTFKAAPQLIVIERRQVHTETPNQSGIPEQARSTPLT